MVKGRLDFRKGKRGGRKIERHKRNMGKGGKRWAIKVLMGKFGVRLEGRWNISLQGRVDIDGRDGKRKEIGRRKELDNV